jgi:hypothetical protein
MRTLPLKEELEKLIVILSASEETPLQTLLVRILPLKEDLDLEKLTLTSLPMSVLPEETLLSILSRQILQLLVSVKLRTLVT